MTHGNDPVRVGVLGTSWWADAMYMPALATHPQATVMAIAGRNRERAEAFAARWGEPAVFLDGEALIRSGLVDAVIVATGNDSHYPLTMAALDAGLHVLCEKPLALTADQADEMAVRAEEVGVKHMVPFTYQYMPTARYLKALVDDGYVGRPYHLNMRYYTGFGRAPAYKWRFDVALAGTGVVGDIGSHFLYLAEWYFGEITGLHCRLGYHIERPPTAPDGRPVTVGDDTAIITLQFANSADGVIHVSSMAYEDTPFGQIHQMEFHGAGGTLHYFNDWDRTQVVSGAREGEGAVKPLAIPDHFWGRARRDTVHNTYRDVFREESYMTRAFISAIVEDGEIDCDFRAGARVQRLVATAVASHARGAWLPVGEA